MSIIARLAVKLGIDTVEFTKGLDDAQKKSKEFQQNQKALARQAKIDAEELQSIMLATTGIVTAVGIATVAAFRHADEISDTAKAFDLNVESLLAVQSALQASGGEAENFVNIFSKLASNQEAAQTGNTAMRESFAKLKIAGEEVDKLKIDELFKRIAKELSKTEDATKRNAIAMEILGKGVKGVNWADFIDKYKEFSDPALAASVEKNAEAWGKIELSMKNISMLMQSIAAPMADMVNDSFKVAENFKKMEMQQYGVASIFALMFAPKAIRDYPITEKKPEKFEGQDFPVKPRYEGDYAVKAKTQVDLQEKLQSQLKKQNQEHQKRVGLLNESIAAQSKELSLQMQMHSMSANDYEIAQKKLQLNNEILKLESDRTKEIAAARAEYDLTKSEEKNKALLEKKIKNINDYYKTAIPAQKELNQITISQLEKEIELRNKYIYQDLENQKIKEIEAIDLKRNAQMEMLDLESRAFKLSTNDYNLLKLKIEAAQQLADVENRYAEKRRALQVEYERTAQSGKDRELFDKKIKDLQYLQEMETRGLSEINMKREDNLQKDIERQQSWSAGWNDAMKKYSEASERASERGRAAFESVTSNMESAIRRFVDTGKFAFKDFVASVIKDLLVMEARAQASMILRSIISSFGGMPTGGGGGGGSAGSVLGDLFGGKKAAAGGAINSPTLVGENGAELFIPSTPGTVIPHGSWQQMAAAGSNNNGITVNGNYIANMSAIDTQSATQFLAKNKNAIWASYQSANRSVPISR
jgi:lambda family phage tail tape measure protein